MARHRQISRPPDSGGAPRLAAMQVVTAVKRLRPSAIRTGVTRGLRAPALSVAVIAPLVLASAAGGDPGQRTTLSTAVAAAPVIPVAVVSPAPDLGGPGVVAITRALLRLHMSTAATPAPPPPLVVNSATVLGIPSTALAAYQSAAQKMAVSDPACGISWNILAGIGRIESGHANGGATDAHGTAVRPIYGPTLDGTLPGNEVIVASSGAGGTTYARAMGPMQFLPGTWARYAADGDGDGVADPQNLNDSALTAARYLCSGNLNLRDPSQATAAILRYNNSMPYARNVLGWAAAYASGVVPVDLPQITGAAPPLGDMHLESPRGLGPGLPLNVHGLPSSDPMALNPLIDLGGPPGADLPRTAANPPAVAAPPAPNCTLICIGR